MHHVSVIGLRPDDATMTVIKVDARHNLWPIFHTVGSYQEWQAAGCRRTQRPAILLVQLRKNVEKYVIYGSTPCKLEAENLKNRIGKEDLVKARDDDNNNTLLHRAIQDGLSSMLEIFVVLTPTAIDLVNKNGFPPLHSV